MVVSFTIALKLPSFFKCKFTGGNLHHGWLTSMKWFPGCNRTYVELRRDGLTIRFPLSIIRYDSDDSGHADEYFTENSTSNLVDRAREKADARSFP